jgi:DMSO reductase iron-sulfur subunit
MTRKGRGMHNFEDAPKGTPITAMSYGFSFDARACSGCKACQEACKDKNQLPAGILWRRVIEVSGGEWQAAGSAWENSVFAYNLSIACNHCTHPKCAGVCPTDAYTVRPDGIVLIDASRCMGCGYCAWACPYGVPQYDAQQGIMTKCDFCHDAIDAGLPPSCVAACPLRVLDYGTLESFSTQTQSRPLWLLPGNEHPFPLPIYSRTEPHLVITPHPGMGDVHEKAVSNQEELLPAGAYENAQRKIGFHELPLVAFTLLEQMAAGIALGSLMISPVPLPIVLAIGLLLGLGGLFSFLHLGHKRNAWRAVTHLKKSWLSREVLLTGLFGIAWVVAIAAELLGRPFSTTWPMAILGVGMVYCMGQVYLLRAVPAWNNWHTPLAFFLSAIVLGTLGMNLLVPAEAWVVAATIAMAIELGLGLTKRVASNETTGWLQISLLGLAILVCLLIVFTPQTMETWQRSVIFALALVAEVIGRWRFYSRRRSFPMQLQ